MDGPKPIKELTRIREERGLSQQGLADVSGVNKVTINQIERGRRSPNLETLEKLADALSIEMADFFPKAQAPLPLDVPSGGDGSLTLTFSDVVQDLRRTTARHEGFHAVQRGLNEFCDVWEKRLAEGDFDQAAIEETGRTINFFWPAVTAAADAEMVDGLRFGTYEEVLAEAKVFPAIRRFQALCDDVNRASREQFRNAASSNVVWLSERKAS